LDKYVGLKRAVNETAGGRRVVERGMDFQMLYRELEG